jgi:hypothetical protein
MSCTTGTRALPGRRPVAVRLVGSLAPLACRSAGNGNGSSRWHDHAEPCAPRCRAAASRSTASSRRAAQCVPGDVAYRLEWKLTEHGATVTPHGGAGLVHACASKMRRADAQQCCKVGLPNYVSGYRASALADPENFAAPAAPIRFSQECSLPQSVYIRPQI